MRKTTVTNVENNMVVQKFEKKTWKKLMKTQIKIWNYWQWKESRQRSLRYKKEENCHVLKKNNWELLRNPTNLGPNLWTLRNPATCKFKLVYFKLWAQTCEVLKPCKFTKTHKFGPKLAGLVGNSSVSTIPVRGPIWPSRAHYDLHS